MVEIIKTLTYYDFLTHQLHPIMLNFLHTYKSLAFLCSPSFRLKKSVRHYDLGSYETHGIQIFQAGGPKDYDT